MTGRLTAWGAGLLELTEEAGDPIPREALRVDGARAQSPPGIRWHQARGLPFPSAKLPPGGRCPAPYTLEDPPGLTVYFCFAPPSSPEAPLHSTSGRPERQREGA